MAGRPAPVLAPVAAASALPQSARQRSRLGPASDRQQCPGQAGLVQVRQHGLQSSVFIHGSVVPYEFKLAQVAVEVLIGPSVIHALVRSFHQRPKTFNVLGMARPIDVLPGAVRHVLVLVARQHLVRRMFIGVDRRSLIHVAHDRPDTVPGVSAINRTGQHIPVALDGTHHDLFSLHPALEQALLEVFVFFKAAHVALIDFNKPIEDVCFHAVGYLANAT